MIFNVTGILIFLSVCGIVASNPDRAIDCRKFVFAPLCRGVAAKRGILDPGHSGQDVNEESFRNLLKNLHAAISLLRVLNSNEQDPNKESKDKYNAENLAKIKEQNRYNRFLRFIFDSRKSSSEKDNLPASEFENL